LETEVENRTRKTEPPKRVRKARTLSPPPRETNAQKRRSKSEDGPRKAARL
jgi:hypothetical protein